MAQLVEHIVHIDGVTGSSPVATTTKPRRHKAFEVFSVSWTSALLPVGGPDRHTISFYQLRSFTNIQNFECAVSFSMLTGWSPISFTRVDVNGLPDRHTSYKLTAQKKQGQRPATKISPIRITPDLDSVYLRSSQNSQPNSDASDVNSRKERGRVFRIARSDPPPAF